MMVSKTYLRNPRGPPGQSLVTEVNISSYPATEVAGSFFFHRAEILNSGGFVQKYSDQGVSCKNIGQLNHLENLQRYYEIMACPMGAMFIERKSNGPLNHKIKGNTMYLI